MKGTGGVAMNAGATSAMSGSVGSFEAGPQSTGPISMPKADIKSSGPINLKNGLDGNHARSESLAFKAKTNEKIFNLEQPAIKFKDNTPASSAGEKKVNQAHKIRTNARLEYTRQELGKLIQIPSTEQAIKRDQQINEVRMLTPKNLRSEGSRQRVMTSYETFIGKPKPEVKHQEKTEVKPVAKPEIRTVVKQKVNEALKKMAIQVETKRQTKTATKAEVKTLPFSTEKYQQVVEEKVQAKLALKSGTKTEAKTKTETSLETKIHTQHEVKPEVKITPAVKTEKEVEESVATVVKTQVPEDETEKEVKKKKRPEEENPDKHAFFETYEKAKLARKLEGKLAFIKASIEAKLRNAKKVTGEDVFRFIDLRKYHDTQSRSIDGIEPDGTVEKSLERVARAGEIVNVKDMERLMDDINDDETPTNLTEHPTDDVLDVNHARKVHGKDEFYAWKDGKLAKVRLENKTYSEAA